MKHVLSAVEGPKGRGLGALVGKHQMMFEEIDLCVRDALLAGVRGEEPSPHARDALLRAAVDRLQSVREEKSAGRRHAARSGVWDDRAAQSAQDGAALYRIDVYLLGPSIAV